MKSLLTIAIIGVLAWPVVAAAGEPEKSHHEGSARAVHHETSFTKHEPTLRAPAMPPSDQRHESFHWDRTVRAALHNDPFAHGMPIRNSDRHDRHDAERGGASSIKKLLEHDPALRKALTDPYVNALNPATLRSLHILPEYLATLGLGPVVSSLIIDYANAEFQVPTIKQQQAAILAYAIKNELLNPPHKTWTPSRIEARYDAVDDHHYAQSMNHNIPTQPTYCRFC